MATHPLDLVHIDSLTTQSGKTDKEINMFVITGHFIGYVQTFLSPFQTANVTAQTAGQIFENYGFPGKILSEQHCNFKNKLITELCSVAHTKKLHTTPFRPHTNGQCERFKFTLISVIGSLLDKAKLNWQEHVSTLVHGYNFTKSNIRGFSPHFPCMGIFQSHSSP